MECGLKPGCAPTDSGKSGAAFAENEDGFGTSAGDDVDDVL